MLSDDLLISRQEPKLLTENVINSKSGKNLCFDIEDDSDVSDVTDNFEEFHRNSFLRPHSVPNKKYLTKYEADCLTVDAFTDEFKKAMVDTRKELGIENSLFQEQSETEVVLSLQQHIQCPRNIEKEEAIILEDSFSSRSSTDTNNSLTWIMLKANCTSNFQISAPVFNAFKYGKPHWLERPNIPWIKMEKSRLKCEEWLNEFANEI